MNAIMLRLCLRLVITYVIFTNSILSPSFQDLSDFKLQMFPEPRRRSVDSFDSEEAHMKDQGQSSYNHSSFGPAMPQPEIKSASGPHFPSAHAPAMPDLPSHASHGLDQKSLSDRKVGSPPPYTTGPPSSGFRLPLIATDVFPDPQRLGQPPCYDADGSPIYIGSALMGNSVHPCKIGKHLIPHAAVPYGGAEHSHHGRYDLLPYLPNQMEFVPTSNGKIPYGRRPIEGGYEEHGAKLYHAVGLVNGIRVPGKTGEHLSVFFVVSY